MKLFDSPNRQDLVFTSHEKEKLRLIGQELKYMGLKSTLTELGREAGVVLDHPVIGDLQQFIMAAQWDEAYRSSQLLFELVDESVVNNIQYLIIKRKFYELLETQDFAGAFLCMRGELAGSLSSCPLDIARLVVSTQPENPQETLQQRERLVHSINETLPCDVIVPPRRLRRLLQQSYEQQVGRCLWHNMRGEDFEKSSLFVDHRCPKDVLPINAIKILSFSDEVLSVRFSPDGSHLAAGTKDGNLVIFAVNNSTFQLTRKHMVECSTSNDTPLSSLVWHPDGQSLLCGVSGSPSNFVIVFIMESGSCRRITFNCDVQQITWDTINREQFFVGGRCGNIILSNMGGTTVFSHQGYRAVAIHCLRSGLVILADTQRRVVSYNLISMVFEVQFTEESEILSMEFDSQEELLALTLNNSTISVWDLKARTRLHTYFGAVYNTMVVRSSFGGANQSFLVSGSEDGYVYMWNHAKQRKLFTLSGHSKAVTAVHWNPTNPMMMASCSDDEKVIIWGPDRSRIDS